MKERVIDVDIRDARVWELITDVPKVKTPWQYLCFILNVIIPGKIICQLKPFLIRPGHYDNLRFLRKMVQDSIHGRTFLTLPCLYPDWLDLQYLLGCAYSAQKLGR